VLAYHTRSKHALNRYAAGPGTLDWEAQPAAFRDWIDAQQIALPRDVVVSGIPWSALSAAHPSLPLNTPNLGSFLRLCVGLTAWKEYAGSRWSLRAHPSSGNLHPTETWLIAADVAGLENGLYHYQNLHHALERRAWGGESHPSGVWLGFSSIHWREAWKYGERAFRYCQLDMGHVLAAVSYAAALHGWKPRLLALDSDAIAGCLGLDREADFAGVENEEAEVIIALEPTDEILPSSWKHWAGEPGLLDPRPLHQWPVIEEVAKATRGLPPAAKAVTDFSIPRQYENDIRAAEVILKRRSAQAFDGESVMPRAIFKQMLAGLLPADLRCGGCGRMKHGYIRCYWCIALKVSNRACMCYPARRPQCFRYRRHSAIHSPGNLPILNCPCINWLQPKRERLRAHCLVIRILRHVAPSPS